MTVFWQLHKPVFASRKVMAGVCALSVAAALAACSPRITPRGNMPDPERLAEIQPGQQTREEVSEILGSPSTVGNFNGEAWIYIAEQTETVAFFAPEVTERNVVVVQFDPKGVVSSVRKLTLADGKELEPVARETPTEGNKITLVQQLLGNIGRFSGDKK